MNHQSFSPVVKHFAWLWRSPTASEALSYGLNLKIFLGEHAPDTPRTLSVIRPQRKKFGALHAPHGRLHQPHSTCAPPFLNLWIHPCFLYLQVLLNVCTDTCACASITRDDYNRYAWSFGWPATWLHFVHEITVFISWSPKHSWWGLVLTEMWDDCSCITTIGSQ